MRIPTGPAGSPAEGFPTLRTQHIRTFGAGSVRMLDMEPVHGCPAQYKARYVDSRVAAVKTADQLTYGQAIHDALYLMEEEPIGPDEALERRWPAQLPVTYWQEAKADLERYLERGGPMTRYATLAVEVELFAHLYDDEEWGPIWYGGRLDWLGVDLLQTQTMHVVDYKTNRWPPTQDDVKGDVQLISYDWLVRENWARLGLTGRPSVVVHLDAIKFRDVEWRFPEQQLEEWRAWATAIARTILRDKKGEERLGPGCHWCPIKLDCKKFKALPNKEAQVVVERKVSTPIDELWAWREEAAAMVKTLKAGIDEVDDLLAQKLDAEGEVQVPGQRWTQEVAWGNVLDKQALLRVIGSDDYVRLSGFTKKAIDEYARMQPESLRQQIEACWGREATGVKTKKEKVE